MNDIVQALKATVIKAKSILTELTDEQLTDASVPPYYSCVGTHIRHILDFYRCIDNGLEAAEVDLTSRNRNSIIENNRIKALNEVEAIYKMMDNWSRFKQDKKIMVIDDLGSGKQRIDYTLAALTAQANSHTIHHFALINYMLDRMGVRLNDSEIGYNPTTPRPDMINLQD
ncbi:MAG: hypothetical protein KJN59_00340 [Bacteroidia bacterium]|nr:hypothetical protein [Bacteroidia bacterium]